MGERIRRRALYFLLFIENQANRFFPEGRLTSMRSFGLSPDLIPSVLASRN